MKRFISLLLLLTLCIGVNAQDKFFNKALEEGRQNRQFYIATNDSKGMSLDKVVGYAKKHNLILGRYTMKEVKRFGDKTSVIDQIYFIPISEYPKYVFEFIDVPDQVKFSDLNQTGSCWVYNNSDFVKFDDFQWSGTVQSGMLNGQGVAYKIIPEKNLFYYLNADFQNGLPKGDCSLYRFAMDSSKPETVVFQKVSSIYVGELKENLARFSDQSVADAKWGFVSNDAKIVITPSYENVLKDFSGGKAEVMADGKEIIIGSNGAYIDLTPRQKKLIAAQEAKEKQEELRRQQEQKEKELAARQERIERERLAREAEKRRVEKFRNARPGDKVYYSQDWQHTETYLLFFQDKTSYTMRVTCFVEQNVDNGERLQIRVGNVESSSSRYYSTPEIDGIKYSKGDIIWIKPLNDSRWQIE